MTIHNRITEYLEGTLDHEEEATFLDHVEVCEECQRRLDAELQPHDRDAVLSDRLALAAEPSHGHAVAYLDGALGHDAETRFLDHMAVCTACQLDLHMEIELRDSEQALRMAAAAQRPVEPRAISPEQQPRNVHHKVREFNRRLLAWSGAVTDGVKQAGRQVVLWLAAIPAAAAILLVLFRTGAPTLSVGPVRLVEIRFSHRAAAAHREYSPHRAGKQAAENISAASIAEFEKAGDCHGVATARVLAGELKSAEQSLENCSTSTDHANNADLDADRAGLAVLHSDFEKAVELSERALDANPDHAAALWNRGLALRGLGLELAAAAAFERVATLDAKREPAWAREASEKASAMRAEIERFRRSYEDVDRLGKQMARGGPPVSADLAGAVPSRSRVHLHDAIRTATTTARLDELEPLASALERHTGAKLVRYLESARAHLPAERVVQGLATDYKELIAKPRSIGDETWAGWLERATSAHADDLILGARILTERLDGDPSAEQLADATGDPWFQLAVKLARVRVALNAGRIEEAVALLTTLQERCPLKTMPYRCLQFAVESSRLAIDRHLPSEAKRFAVAAKELARRLGEWPQRNQSLILAADAARFEGKFAVAAAYFEEARLSLKACGAHDVAFTVAEMLFQRHRFAQARAQIAEAPACDRASGPVELAALVRLLRVGHAVVDRAQLTAKIADSRSNPQFARDAPYFDYLAAWLLLDDDPAARSQLARAADDAPRIEGSMREKTIAGVNNALLADAGRRAAWKEVVAVAASAHNVPIPSRCALAIGADDFRFAAVAVGPDGSLIGHHDPDLVRPAEWLAPPLLRQNLAGCEEVAVLALPPWLGIAPIVEPQVPWHYVLGPAHRPAAVQPRHVIIASPTTPEEVDLAPLPQRALPELDGTGEVIQGVAATPERVLAAISDATLVEIHSHATWLPQYDAPVLALSPGSDGWTLSAAQIRSATLRAAPVVVLAACEGALTARYEHAAWGLPQAFRIAGASAVIAPGVAVPDKDASEFFDAVVREISGGTAPARAVARVRSQKIRNGADSWMRHVLVFQ
jgi:cellulose synthase operon protein C